MNDPDLRKTLRGLRVFDVELSSFDLAAAPAMPDLLFADWLKHAINVGVREPHAMTLSTVDADGRPNSRVLILKGLCEGRWGFATSRASRKGGELDVCPWAALSFHWPEVGRQVRVRGRVLDCGPDAAASDFAARPQGSRAAAWVGNQSEVLYRPGDLEQAFDEAREKVVADPMAVPAAWTRYDVVADEVEFWQADRERRHRRLRYIPTAGGWRREELWP